MWAALRQFLAPLLAALAPLFKWVMRTAAMGMVLRIFTGLGLGLGTYKAFIQPFSDWVRSGASSIDPSVVQWLGVLRLDVAVTIILSAYATRAVFGAVHLVKK